MKSAPSLDGTYLIAMVHSTVPTLRPIPVVSHLRPVFAAGAAILVLALAVFTVSPGWHHALHNDGGPANSEGCAVDLFAQGVALSLGTVPVLPASISPCPPAHAPAAIIYLVSPRYLHQPERGPPVC
mgnify:CR=1 FL=1